MLSVIAIWPDQPHRYLPDFIPLPSGAGVHLGGFEREAMRLGLDLQGGTRLVLEADPGFEGDLAQALAGAQTVIERRVNAYGVAESEINRLGGNRLEVQLPGVKPEEARTLVGKTAALDFREPVGASGGGVQRDENGRIVWAPSTGSVGGEQKALTGQYLKANAYVSTDTVGRPAVSIEFNGEGSSLFEQITNRLAQQPSADGRRLGIFLDDEIVSGPAVSGPISGGLAIITGLTLEDARTLEIQLNAGALPVSLNVVQQDDVDATLGEDTVINTVRAGEIALVAVAFFMLAYYRLPGLMAVGALFVYTTVLLALFKLWPVTITLAGIAAFVLSVGMAVDANILIFERMKEELRSGRSLQSSIEVGFARAWTSIWDSNVSTLFTCGILYWFGDQFAASLVKGFALTLGIGVLLSMFTARTVTQTFLRFAIGSPLARRLSLFAPGVADRPVSTRTARGHGGTAEVEQEAGG